MLVDTIRGLRLGAKAVLLGLVLLLFSFAPADAQKRWKFNTNGRADVVDTANIGSLGYTKWTFFPSASTTDGRFLSICGASLKSLGGDSIIFGIGLPSLTDTLRIQIFDGETGGLWDLGSTALTYRVYADPTARDTGTTLLGTWSGSSMTDNGWYSIKIPTGASARNSVDSSYFYRLVVYISDPSQKAWSNFKMRTNGTAALLPRAFAFSAPMFSTSEARIIYPDYPTTTRTTYDGTWNFKLYVPEAVEALEVWDGDLDFGSSDGTARDTDDVDTPNSVPSWANANIVSAEGVATGDDFIVVSGVRSTTARATGSPADDNANALYRRTPAVTYEVVDPNGTVYTNSNPSGNLEWERFRISTITGSRSSADYLAPVLPSGTYELNLSGMDLGNINAWKVGYDILGMTDTTAALTDANRAGGSFYARPVIAGVDASGRAVNMLLPASVAIGGTGSIGYWANRPADWPVKVITIGDTMLTRAQAVAILKSNSNNRSMTMARHLIATKLNIMAGNASSCILEDVRAADQWLISYPLTSTNGNWTTGVVIKNALESYNKGELDCADGNGQNGVLR